MIIPAAVLDDGTRVISERGMSKALGAKRGGSHWQRKKKAEEEGGAFLPVFLSANNLKPFVSNELALALSTPILYRVPGSGGIANGIEANNVPKICRVWMNANIAGVLSKPQQRIARAADILLRGLEVIGIVGLVDEATGYQETRAKDALVKILEAFIAKELREWVSTFPVDYYKELFRLRGWHFPDLPADQKRRPILVGKITNDVIYDRLAPGVREELHRLTPRNEKGRLKHKLFQRLTKETGHPKLKEHLASVTTLMRAADNWPQFMSMLNRSLPRYGDTPYLPFEG
jgi:P63C domain